MMVTNHSNISHHDISIIFCGEAGQGIQTIEQVLTYILKLSGYHIFSTKEYMSRIRGGMNSTEIRVASERISSYVDRVDILIPLTKGAIVHIGSRISDKTLILGEKEKIDSAFNITDIPFSAIASEIGGKIYQNSVAIGIILGIFKVEPEFYNEYFLHHFASKSAGIIDKNINACTRGYEYGIHLLETNTLQIHLKSSKDVKSELVINGAEAVSFGAIAGGCNFVTAYPMSPATGVLVNLAKYSHEFEIAVEQAEDEISAINMALGAWYAGARALVTTSGGGFALMGEGISLCGMTETPVVIHLAQRPGPATGLPTRTEQGDLELALYAGHGEFPRILLAPGTIDQAFYLTQKAFNLADKFQIPVIILTDQYLMDSHYNRPSLNLAFIENIYHIVKTDAAYSRFKFTDNGISPRGIPGFGKGIVCVDSDEHTEEGYITEDLNLRTKMVNKRLKKFESIREDIIPPELIGRDDFDTLVICWGSNYNTVKEALGIIGNKKLAMLHFSQIFPLHPDIDKFIKQAKRIILIENNATAQFGKLVSLHTGIDIHNKILKYNGLPFSVEEIVTGIRRIY